MQSSGRPWSNPANSKRPWDAAVYGVAWKHRGKVCTWSCSQVGNLAGGTDAIRCLPYLSDCNGALWQEGDEPGAVVHACNPSYLGGWGQEDPSSRPAQANSSWDPILTNVLAWWCEPLMAVTVGSLKWKDHSPGPAWAKSETLSPRQPEHKELEVWHKALNSNCQKKKKSFLWRH
jgi:hypothetical protein